MNISHHVNRLAAGVLPLAALALAALAAPAHSAIYRLTRNGSFGVDGDGLCDLDEAVRAVNDRWTAARATQAGCPPDNSTNSERIEMEAKSYSPSSSTTLDRSVEIVGKGIDKTVLNFSLFGFLVNGFPNNPTVNIEKLTIKGTGANGGIGLFVASATAAVAPGPGEPNPTPWLAMAFLDHVRVTNCGLSGIYNEGGVVQLNHCLVNNNTCIAFGGGIRNYGYTDFGGQMYIMNSSIYANKAPDGEGGGIYNAGYLSLWHSTVSGNSASEKGGGIYTGQRRIWPQVNDDDQTHINDDPRPFLELYMSTVASNSAGISGGGIFTDDGVHGVTGTTLGTIIANNTAPSHPDFHGPTGSNQFPGYPNLVRNKSGATQLKSEDITGVDPKLGALGDNGCDAGQGCITRTHALLKGSPAIDANGELQDSEDQRGYLSPVDGGIGKGARHDIGAYEYSPVMQSEKLALSGTSGDKHERLYPVDGNGWTKFSSNATNDYVTYVAPNVASGTYQVKVRIVKNRDAGKFQTSIATSSGGSYSNLGSAQDAYGSSQSFSERTIGTKTFSSSGNKYFRFKVTGRNGSSSGSKLYFDYIKLIKQ